MNQKKLNITKVVLDRLKYKQSINETHITAQRVDEISSLLSVDHDEIDIEKLMPVWWIGGRTTDSMQLTAEGLIAFRHAEIEHHTFDLGEKLLKEYSFSRIYRMVNNKITNPFYLNLDEKRLPNYSNFLGKLILFDSKDAVFLTLKGGTVYDLMQ